MILHVPPGSPALVRDGAAAVLALHIGGGLAGVASGFAALLSPKGGRIHRAAGHVFFVSMLVMSGIGVAVSPFLPNWTNVVMGLFVFYLTATAWMTVRRPAGGIGRFEVGAFVFACGAAGIGVVLGLWAATPGGLDSGEPPAAFFVLASFPAAAAALDLRMIRRGGVTGAGRVSRHLWRMGVALLVAAGSLFLGQPRLFPPALRGTPIMFAPEILIVAAMVVWGLRLRPRKGVGSAREIRDAVTSSGAA